MPLPGVCPACGATFSLEQALADGEARAALGAALMVPPEIGARVVRYLGLHAPAGRRLQWPKLTRLIVELTERIQAAGVSRRGVTHACPLATWAAALNEVLTQRDAGALTLPLKGHGYLDEIAWRLSGSGAAPRRGARGVSGPGHPRPGASEPPPGRAADACRGPPLGLWGGPPEPARGAPWRWATPRARGG